MIVPDYATTLSILLFTLTVLPSSCKLPIGTEEKQKNTQELLGKAKELGDKLLRHFGQYDAYVAGLELEALPKLDGTDTLESPAKDSKVVIDEQHRVTSQDRQAKPRNKRFLPSWVKRFPLWANQESNRGYAEDLEWKKRSSSGDEEHAVAVGDKRFVPAWDKRFVPAWDKRFVPAWDKRFVPAWDKRFVPAWDKRFVPAWDKRFVPAWDKRFVPAWERRFVPSWVKKNPSGEKRFLPAWGMGDSDTSKRSLTKEIADKKSEPSKHVELSRSMKDAFLPSWAKPWMEQETEK